ncbi:PHB depolymerase family esterase [Variovorax sp. J22R133]|uniref:extracellular catalytic domain type 1 short-chain-length polyhydroxyalkanoate depolymerase n=1 Tax=Variovorax brevis TaxID=3053503 RepID=UPI002576DC3E|nr:PHB depolymerase family esterase [Variovorax sp. J22R133]MDM0111633.1 PHB depolymerase family esterase [Variovorax sp. J22R133]
MARRKKAGAWTGIFARSMEAFTRMSMRASTRAVDLAVKPVIEKRRPPAGAGQWISGVAMGAAGMRRFKLYRPPGVKFGERLPLMVMLHGCGQDAKTFATSTRMNRIAARERFMVLYPEQDRVSNPQGCWNWFDTSSGRAYGEAGLIMKAIDQVCLMYGVDRTRIAVAGLSAGASMAALLVTRHPERFGAVVMHSGIPPWSARSALSALGAMHGHRSTKPVPVTLATITAAWPPLMVIHGALDRVVVASNGNAAAQAWADAAGATSNTVRSVQRGNRYPTSVTDFKRRGKTVATLVEVDRLGHAWSGGAAQAFSDGKGPDASRMVWAFAAKQFRK